MKESLLEREEEEVGNLFLSSEKTLGMSRVEFLRVRFCVRVYE